MTQPFKIESVNINRLGDIQLTQLLKELLHAEAYKFGIAQRSAEVALNIRVGDGGEDGRISWNNGPEETDYIPNRITIFQNKATDMGAADYANEIMTKARSGHPSVIKPKVEEVVDQGGSYVVFTTQELNTQQKDVRIAAVRDKLRGEGKAYPDTCDIRIYDAAQIAGWTNQFVPTVVSVQNWSGVPVERGLKTYSSWSEYDDFSRLPFATVVSRQDVLLTLTEKIEEPKSCFRVTGLSGLGKTRTAFQVFKENKNLRNLVVYVDANHAPKIDALVADWVSLGLKTIVVVDNCEYRLHESLVKEVRRENSQISLLTLDYNTDTVGSTSAVFKLEAMTDEELLQLLSPIYKEQLPDLDRVVAFAQGFPQMAFLLAEARLAEDPRIGELTEDDLAQKLLWRRDEAGSQETLNILQACALFDVFGVDQEVEDQLQFIADVVGLDINKVYECVHDYSDRGIIDRRGRFGQLVPKPLAIRLASQWWSKSRDTKKNELVGGLPQEMIEGFCHQVEKLDFHPDVKNLTEKLCGPKGPFGQAEVILSVRGSRLFRAFVNVNPESTSEALYKTMEGLDHQQLSEIVGDTRRNLVWALEKLCYHENIFHESAWCMLLLASAENEKWSNNATAMFAQLFRVKLSGTEARPETRFNLMKRALELNSPDVDMVLLEALKEAIDIHGGSRTVGAEYQGMKSPLEEWRPELWQEIFDFWQESFDLMLGLLERGNTQKEKVMADLGHSIRGFIAHGRIEMLDSAIRKIIAINGRYWPAALESIKKAFKYDSEGMRQEATDALNIWLDLLNPDNAELPEKLSILVINPPWEHHKGEDGHYIDVASENAKALATKVSRNIDELLPLLASLLQGEQKQSYAFGNQLARDLVDARPLLDLALQCLVTIDRANSRFVLGLYRGFFEKSPELWQESIDKLLTEDQLVYLYPDAICTGDIRGPHLHTLLDLIRCGELLPERAVTLSYGRVTNGIEPDVMADFCLKLAELGDQASWSALNVIFMYCFGNMGRIGKLRDQLKGLVADVPLHKVQKVAAADIHQWHDMAEKLLEKRDQELAIALAYQLTSACKHGLDHGDIRSYIKPLMLQLMQDYGEVLWPIFSDAIIQAEGMELFWLQKLLDRETGSVGKVPSALTFVPTASVIDWCAKIPDLGPVFVAGCLNILETADDRQRPTELFVALLERFGDDKRVINSLKGNIGSRGWSGSLVPHLEADKAALSPLLDHGNDKVRRWIKGHIAYIDRQIAFEFARDDEHHLGVY